MVKIQYSSQRKIGFYSKYITNMKKKYFNKAKNIAGFIIFTNKELKK
jgi:hypothetical protein